MKAIIVKYLGPTNFKVARLKASMYGAKSLTVEYDHAQSEFDNAHLVAFSMIFKNIELNGELFRLDQLIGGQLPSGDYVFIPTWEKKL